MRMFRIWFLLVCVVSSTDWAFCQNVQAKLSGRVYSTGVALDKVSLTLKNLDTNQVYTASSRARGHYNFSNLPPGNTNSLPSTPDSINIRSG